MKSKTIGLPLVALLGLAAHATGAIVTVPEGLNPGDQYRLIFVTSTTTAATNATAAYYNDFVNNLAQSVPTLAALGVTWKAAANLNGLTPDVNTGTTGTGGMPTFRLDGVLFAHDYTDLWDKPGPQDNSLSPTMSINVNEQGTTGVAYNVWTGMNETMSDPSWNPSQYLGSSGTLSFGVTGEGDGWHTWGFFGQPATNEYHLYAISDVITVVPEPSAALLGGLGMLGLLRRRRA